MSDRCPLLDLDPFDKPSLLWDGNFETGTCINRCVIPQEDVASKLGTLLITHHDMPEGFDSERDDTSHHFGVEIVGGAERKGYHDFMVDNGNDNIPIEETVFPFFCTVSDEVQN